MQSLILPSLVTAAVLLLPGVAVSLTLGLRGMLAVAVAGPVSVAILSVAGLGAALIGLSWGPLPILLFTLAAAGAGFGVKLLGRRYFPAPSEPSNPSRELLSLLGLALAAALMTLALLGMIGRPENFSLTLDNVYHTTLIRHFLDTSSASPLVPLDFGVSAGPRGFYPAAWHQLVALIASLTHSSIPLASNAVMITVAALVWPSSVIFVVRTITLRPVTIVLACVLAVAFPNFPIMILDFGVLYPYFLGLSFVLIGIALVFQLLRFGAGERFDPLTAGYLLAATCAALALAHPGSLLVLIAVAASLTATWLGYRIWQRCHAELSSAQLWVSCAVTGLVLVLGATLWVILRPHGSHWEPISSPETALGQFLFASTIGHAPSYLIFGLVILGCYAAVRKAHNLFVLAPMAVLLFLWVVTASWKFSLIRTALVGGFYSDPFRLGSLVAIALLPVIAIGLDQCATILAGRLGRAPRRALAGATIVAAVLATQLTPPIPGAVKQASHNYQIREKGDMLTRDEFALIQRLPELVPATARILVDPWNGSGFVYGLTGIHTSAYHLQDLPSPSEQLLLDQLSRPVTLTAVCQAISQTGVTHVLDFGDVRVHNRGQTPPGLRNLSSSPMVKNVAHVGPATLYEIVGCHK